MKEPEHPILEKLCELHDNSSASQIYNYICRPSYLQPTFLGKLCSKIMRGIINMIRY